jgi:hypothetical protein
VAEDIRVLVPRVRRAVEGVGGNGVLTDNQVKDLVADAIADVILYSGGLFGHELLVTATLSGGVPVPTEYATEPALTLAEGSVIAAQAALNHLTRELALLKTGETIRDEGQEWSWQTSAQAVSERVKELREARDRALEVIAAQQYVPVTFTSFLAVRDRCVAGLIEPHYIG